MLSSDGGESTLELLKYVDRTRNQDVHHYYVTLTYNVNLQRQKRNFKIVEHSLARKIIFWISASLRNSKTCEITQNRKTKIVEFLLKIGISKFAEFSKIRKTKIEKTYSNLEFYKIGKY